MFGLFRSGSNNLRDLYTLVTRRIFGSQNLVVKHVFDLIILPNDVWHLEHRFVFVPSQIIPRTSVHRFRGHA